MARNPNLEELETLLDPGLPEAFELFVPDAWIRGALVGGLVYSEGPSAGRPLPATVTRVRLNILGHAITVRADSDPDEWVEH